MMNRQRTTLSCCVRGMKDESMCLAVPMEIKSIEGFRSVCEARGIEREVNLYLLQEEELGPGDYVLVHVGYAIQKISRQHAVDSWQLLEDVTGL